MIPAHADRPARAAITRLQSLSHLGPGDIALVEEAANHAIAIPAHRELMREGAAITETLLLLDGWAARVRYLPDGRRQIVSFVLPGDLLGLCDHHNAVMSSTIVALTPLLICKAPPREASGALGRCYAVSRAIDEANLLGQITRLGRMSAYERIIDLLLELHERLAVARLADRGRYQLPLTQESLADALGLTSVHVNRMLQQARRTGDLRLVGREIVLNDVEALQHAVGRQPVRVKSH